jgi:hypothetical protein
MSDEVLSYQQYRSKIRSLLAPLISPQAVRFCAWSVGRFPMAFGEAVWDGLTEAERSSLRGAIDELEASASSGRLLSPDRAAVLQQLLQSFGPTGDVAAIEVHPDGVEFRSLVWQTLEYCRTQDPAALCAVSEAFINSWDYQVEQQGGGYSLDNMFSYPQLNGELALQTEYIAALGKT